MTEAELSVAMAAVAKQEMQAFKMAEMVDGAAPVYLTGRSRNVSKNCTIEEYQACADQGMSAIETARHLGVSRFAVDYAAREHGVKFADGRSKHPGRSGYPGVSWHARDGRWQVRANLGGEIFFVGMFRDVKEAAAAREKFIAEKKARKQ
jgi:hypothetical protein